MNNIKIALFIFALFIAFWFVPLIILKSIRGQEVTALHFAITSASLVAIVAHFVGIW